MIGLDRTGLSDPYVRITLGSQTVISKTMYQTNNPRWEQTVTISDINLFDELDCILTNPPEIVLEVFDRDTYGVNEFMGKCYVKPVINIHRGTPPKLKWYRLFHRFYETPGDILASFELILKTKNEKAERTLSLESMRIPSIIVPKMGKYSLEILYWGVRNVKQKNSMLFGNLEKIKIEIEIGGISYYSDLIENLFPNDNFHSNTHKKIENIELPEENEYKPNLNIRCLAENSFSKKKPNLIGSFTVKSINDYFKDEEELSNNYKIFSIQRFNSNLSESKIDSIELFNLNENVRR